MTVRSVTVYTHNMGHTTTTATTLCLGPIPDHLRLHDWYAPHQAWLRDQGLPHHDPGDADPCRARLDDACLVVTWLDGARR